jgi:exosortase A-associated hydrolase 2
LIEGGLEARFIDGPRGRIFVIARGAPGQRAMLIVPPFAEEMNKSRRMCTELAVALARRGVTTILPDLFGTGDSEGEFAEADWDAWKDDIRLTCVWAGSTGRPVSMLLGIRLGCLLGAEVAAALPERIERTVFWQPVAEGRRVLTQFLRLRVAASLMEDRKETAEALRERLRAGESIEIAGYELSSRLARQLDGLKLGDHLDERLGELHWMEVVRDPASGLPEGSSQTLAQASARVGTCRSHAVGGDSFWASTEITLSPELLSRTVEVVAA